MSVANQRLYLLQQLMCQGLSCNALHITHCIHCYSFVCCHIMLFQLFLDSCLAETKTGWMDSFAKLLSEDCFQMFFILMTSRVMLIPNYFARRQTKDTVCTHCCPNKDPKKLLSSLRSRGHSYTLPHIEFSLYENSFVNRCLFAMI